MFRVALRTRLKESEDWVDRQLIISIFSILLFVSFGVCFVKYSPATPNNGLSKFPPTPSIGLYNG
jgi:hypothetical protein